MSKDKKSFPFLLLLLVFAIVLSSCSLFAEDDGKEFVKKDNGDTPASSQAKQTLPRSSINFNTDTVNESDKNSETTSGETSAATETDAETTTTATQTTSAATEPTTGQTQEQTTTTTAAPTTTTPASTTTTSAPADTGSGAYDPFTDTRLLPFIQGYSWICTELSQDLETSSLYFGQNGELIKKNWIANNSNPAYEDVMSDKWTFVNEQEFTYGVDEDNYRILIDPGQYDSIYYEVRKISVNEIELSSPEDSGYDWSAVYFRIPYIPEQ